MCFCSMLLVSANNTLVRVSSTIPGTDIEYNYVENVTVQIPGTEDIFVLNYVADMIGVETDREAFPSYYFHFYEEASCIEFVNNITVLGGSWGYHTADVGTVIECVPGTILNDTVRGNPLYSYVCYAAEDEAKTNPIARINFVFGDCEHDGVMGIKDDIDISEFSPTSDSALTLIEPTKTVIRYKDGIVLHANTKELTEEIIIEWTADNNNFKMKESNDGLSCTIIANSTGNTVVTATLYDGNGNTIGEDSVEMTSKAGFFDKIGGFFRSLFGITKIYES